MDAGTIERHEVDGVPTLLAPATGPTTACLVFRVGMIDEPLPLRGVTHLVEHLALCGLGTPRYEFNGSVSPTETSFYCTGTIGQVRDFLGSVTAAVTSLPLQRLEIERGVLQVERANRMRSLPAWALALRYGASSHGLSDYDELGLDRAAAADIERWAVTAFGRANAALCITGELPSDLQLHLPEGSRRALPAAPAPVRSLPAWTSFGSPGACLSMVVPRSPEGPAVARHLQDRLVARLRHELGLSYEVGVSYTRLDTDNAHLYVSADSLGGSSSRICAEVADIVAAFAEQGATPAEHAADVHAMEEALAAIEPAQRDLEQSMEALLYDREPRLAMDALARLRDVEGPELGVWLRAPLRSALYLVGEGAAAPRSLGCPPLARPPMPPVRGRRLPGRLQKGAADGGGRGVLILGDDGVTMKVGGDVATVRFHQLAAEQVYEDGSRVLYGRDGTDLVIVPRAWEAGHRVIAHLADHVPAQLRVRSAGRPADGMRFRNHIATVWIVPVLVIGLLMLAVGLAPDDPALGDPRSIGERVTGSVIALAIIGWAAVVLRRRLARD